MTTSESILVRALAASDALHLPIRDWSVSFRTSANRAEGLKSLETLGVALRVGGDDASRKTGERQLADLVTDGHIVVTRHGRVKFPFVKLTAVGEARARALCGLPDRAVGRLFLAAVAEHAARFVETISGRWAPEIELNKGRGWGPDATPDDRWALSSIELDFLPAASLGWVEAHSSLRGNVAYRATEAGLAELGTPSTAPNVGALPPFDPDAAQLYRSTQDTKLSELTTEGTGREIGPLPLCHSVLAMTQQMADATGARAYPISPGGEAKK